MRLTLLSWNELRVLEEESEPGQCPYQVQTAFLCPFSDEIKFRSVAFMAGIATPVEYLEKARA